MSLELQSAFAGSVGHRFHAAVLQISTTVEHDFRDARILRFPRYTLADFGSLLGFLSAQSLIGSRHQGPLSHVVHQLSVDMLQRPVDDETRTLARPIHSLADPEMPARAQPFSGPRSHFSHYLPPALPAFRRICSPAYLIPFPLYGSGGLRLLSSAAT